MTLRRHCEYMDCKETELVGRDKQDHINNFAIYNYMTIVFDADLCKKHLKEITDYIRSKVLSTKWGGVDEGKDNRN